MTIRFFVLLFLGISLFLFQCESSPTSSNSNDDPIDSPDNSGDDGSDDEEPEITIIEIPNTYSAFYPYQSLIYYSDEFDIEDYGFEFVYGVDSEDSDYDLYKRFDLVYYQDTLVVGDTLTAKVKEWGQWSITIPRVEPGSYTFKVILREDLLLTGVAEILPIQIISDPANYVQTEVTDFQGMMDIVTQDFESFLDEDFGLSWSDDYHEDVQNSLRLYQELEDKMMVALEAATPEELERLAYFMKAYEELYLEEYESIESTSKLKLTSDPEELFEENKSWFSRKITFSGILNLFKSSDTESVEVGEGDLVETAKTWTVQGLVMSIITGITDRATKVFTLTDDKLTAELKGDYSESNAQKSRSKQKPWPHLDTLYFEYNSPTRLSFLGTYENMLEEHKYLNDSETNLITNELYELVAQATRNFGVNSLYPVLRGDTVNIVERINSKYLEFMEVDNTSIRDLPFYDLFNVERDETTGEFILTAKLQYADGSDVPYYGDLKTETWLKYYQAPEYDEFDYLFVASQCPDFDLFIPGKWESVFYTYDDLAEIFQIDQIEFFEDGTWRMKDYFLVDTWHQYENYATGTWRSGCEDGEAWFYYTDSFFGVTWSFKYDGDKNRLLGYRWRYDSTYNYEGPTQVLRKAEF